MTHPTTKAIKCLFALSGNRCAFPGCDTYLQSVFLQIFGDPVTNSMGWEVSALGNLLKSAPQNGLYVPSEQYESDGSHSGVEMVHMSDLFYEIVQHGNLKRVKTNVVGLDKYSLTHNDLTRRSLNLEGAANPCRIPKSEEPLVFESSMIRITPDQARVLTIYLYYYLANEQAKRTHILKYVTQSTISGINQDGLKRLEIIVSPLPLQQQFAHIVHKFERLRTQQRESARQANHLFQTLLHRAFQGEL